MIRAGQTAWDFLSGTNFWAEMGDFRGKIEEISWMEGGETWGEARSTQNQANPRIKINKTRLENEEGRLRNRDQPGSDTKMMKGGTLDARSFTIGANPMMYTNNTRRKHDRITQTNKNNHTCARSSKHKEIHDPRSTRDDT